MRKSMVVCFAVFGFFLNMLCFWYADTLINRLFIFGMIPIGISLLVLIANILVSVTCFICAKTKRYYLISLIISLVTTITIFAFPFRLARVRTELLLFEKARMQVVEMVINGEIAADVLGNADLPDRYSLTSSDGSVFVYQNDDEQVISFWVFRGILSGSVQLIYSSQDEALIYRSERGHPITNVVELKEHWYLVDTEY